MAARSRRAKGKPRGKPFESSPRKKSAVINIRVRQELRDALDEACKEAGDGRSLALEVERRLQETLTERSAWGGPRESEIALSMGIRFLGAAKRAGEDKFGSNAMAEEWLNDSWCFERALQDVVLFLFGRFPDQSPEGLEAAYARVDMAVRGMIATQFMNDRKREQRK